jgi:hypothetical protein
LSFAAHRGTGGHGSVFFIYDIFVDGQKILSTKYLTPKLGEIAMCSTSRDAEKSTNFCIRKKGSQTQRRAGRRPGPSKLSGYHFMKLRILPISKSVGVSKRRQEVAAM